MGSLRAQLAQLSQLTRNGGGRGVCRPQLLRRRATAFYLWLVMMVVGGAQALCSSFTSCSSCIPVQPCGWCVSSSSCRSGTSVGPSSGSCSLANWKWTSCPSPPPSSNTSAPVQYILSENVPSPDSPDAGAALFVVFYTLCGLRGLYQIIRQGVPKMEAFRNFRHSIPLCNVVWAWVVWGWLTSNTDKHGACGKGAWDPDANNGYGHPGAVMAALFLFHVLVLKCGAELPLTLHHAGYVHIEMLANTSTLNKHLIRLAVPLMGIFYSFFYPVACPPSTRATCITTNDDINCTQGFKEIAESSLGLALGIMLLIISILSIVHCISPKSFGHWVSGPFMILYQGAIIGGVVGGIIVFVRVAPSYWPSFDDFEFSLKKASFNVGGVPFTGSSLLLVSIVNIAASFVLFLFDHVVSCFSPAGREEGDVESNADTRRINPLFNSDAHGQATVDETRH